MWILSRALSAGAPVGAYSGVRIKKGRLQLSSAPTIAGLTLTIPNGARVTLDLELDPTASTAPAATPGQDAHASRVKVPETATFVFTAGGGVLRTAGDASLKVFGAAFARSRRARRRCSTWRARRRSPSARGRFQLPWSRPVNWATRQALVRSRLARKRDSMQPGEGSRPTPAAQSP